MTICLRGGWEVGSGARLSCKRGGPGKVVGSMRFSSSVLILSYLDSARSRDQ